MDDWCHSPAGPADVPPSGLCDARAVSESEPDIASDRGIITRPASGSVDDVVARLLHVIDERGLTLFGVVDHSGEAARAGLSLRDTKLVLFGSPRAGTPIMVAEPLAALDLPLKIVVWADQEMATELSYNSADYLARRYRLPDELRAPLAAIDAIIDAIA